MQISAKMMENGQLLGTLVYDSITKRVIPDSLIVLDGLNMLPSVSGFANAPGYNIPQTRYIVGDTPSGEFSSAMPKDYAIYIDDDTGWLFLEPQNGMELLDTSNGTYYKFNAEVNAWQAVIALGVPVSRSIILHKDNAQLAPGEGPWILGAGFVQKVYDFPGVSSEMFTWAALDVVSVGNMGTGVLIPHTAANQIIFESPVEVLGDLNVTLIITRLRQGIY